ncbi:hypothetical protein IMY05_C0097000300 [Salix suchowensis]|nr:hypothetical protein IMY05_C0097000300 [Salix suchowensis]
MHLQGISAADTAAITDLPGDEEELKPIRAIVYSLLAGLQENVKNSSYQTRRLLACRPPTHNLLAPGSHGLFTTRSTPASLKRYSVVVACLVCFVLRCHRGWDSDYSMNLTSEQKDACVRIDRLLLDTRLEELDADTDTLAMADEMDDDVEEEEEEEEEEEMMVNIANTSNDIFDMDIHTSKPIDGLQRGVLDLLLALYCHLPTSGNDAFFSPLIRFLVLKSRKADGSWLPARRTTQIVAVLLFCGRLAMMSLTCKVMQRTITSASHSEHSTLVYNVFQL